MSLSRELQIGKAGEHLVCCDLIARGISAFLADAGLPYDVLADFGQGVKRIQVRTVTYQTNHGKAKQVYRFGLRSAKYGRRKIDPINLDYIAFVFLDRRIVQYIPVAQLTAKTGYLKQVIDFRLSHNGKWKPRKYIIGDFNDLT